MVKEFKEFVSKGNVMDLAVAVVIGAAFGGIINSLVNDILMPVIGRFTSDQNFSKLNFHLDGVQVFYGRFVNAIVNFLIIAFCLFMVVKTINKMKKKKDEEPPTSAEAKEEIKLLIEIRDLLKK